MCQPLSVLLVFIVVFSGIDAETDSADSAWTSFADEARTTWRTCSQNVRIGGLGGLARLLIVVYNLRTVLDAAVGMPEGRQSGHVRSHDRQQCDTAERQHTAGARCCCSVSAALFQVAWTGLQWLNHPICTKRTY